MIDIDGTERKQEVNWFVDSHYKVDDFHIRLTSRARCDIR